MNSEQTFNVGDEVVCVNNDNNPNITVNKVYKVLGNNLGFSRDMIVVMNDHNFEVDYYAYRFKKKMSYFPCKIVVNNSEENKLVQEWLFEQGAAWQYNAKVVSWLEGIYLYIKEDSVIQYGILGDVFEKHSYPELKFTFKSVIDSVVLEEPKKKTIEIDGKTYDYNAVTERLKSLSVVSE